ncbi:MAG: HU family DNA-binding protein [Clostridia bacterium]|nr:HU family DNA-binding protein [Clostridia bacterium]
MNKIELVKVVADKTGLTQKEVGAVVDELLDAVIADLAKGNEVALAGFGKFVVKTRAARESINPRTKEVIKVPACKAVAYKPSKAIKEAVNKK